MHDCHARGRQHHAPARQPVTGRLDPGLANLRQHVPRHRAVLHRDGPRAEQRKRSQRADHANPLVGRPHCQRAHLLAAVPGNSSSSGCWDGHDGHADLHGLGRLGLRGRQGHGLQHKGLARRLGLPGGGRRLRVNVLTAVVGQLEDADAVRGVRPHEAEDERVDAGDVGPLEDGERRLVAEHGVDSRQEAQLAGDAPAERQVHPERGRVLNAAGLHVQQEVEVQVVEDEEGDSKGRVDRAVAVAGWRLRVADGAHPAEAEHADVGHVEQRLVARPLGARGAAALVDPVHDDVAKEEHGAADRHGGAADVIARRRHPGAADRRQLRQLGAGAFMDAQGVGQGDGAEEKHDDRQSPQADGQREQHRRRRGHLRK
eukprot:m.96447 g.96447  ORF g.96447 m.96447 type:complete len:372 (+) comp15491_c0_seq1:772-1887(+)